MVTQPRLKSLKLIVELTEKQYQTKELIAASGHGNIRKLIGSFLDQVGEIIDEGIQPGVLAELLVQRKLDVKDLLLVFDSRDSDATT